MPQPFSIRLGNRLMDFSRPRVMAILNITPDSFYAASRVENQKQVLARAGKMIDEGADILDVGGYSTRPGADVVSEEEETSRVVAAIEEIHREFPGAVLSVDTFRSGVAKRAVEAGAQLVNDISGGFGDEAMFKTVADLGVPYILMHIRQSIEAMHQPAEYHDITLDVAKELQKQIAAARLAGVVDIMADPGFGFSKKGDQNFELLSRLDSLQILNLPILVGVSRKTMIYKTLNILPEEALSATSALHMAALIKGASILRVHDVKEAIQTVDLFTRLCLPE